MKRILSIISVMVLCLCTLTLAGCNSPEKSGSSSEPEVKVEAEVETEPEPEPATEPEPEPKPEKEKTGIKNENLPIYVVFDEVFISRSYDHDLLVINLEMTNTSDDFIVPSGVLHTMSATWNGSTLESGNVPEYSDNYINSGLSLGAGETAKVQKSYRLYGEPSGEVSLFGVFYTLTDGKQEPYIDENVDISEAERRYTASSFDLAIDNVIKSDDDDGNDIVIVDMTFTNNSTEATSFAYSSVLEIFQNGIELKKGFLPYRHPAYDETLDDNNYLDIRGGNSIKVRVVYELNDPTTEVEVKGVDRTKYDAKPYFEKTIKL